MSSMVDTHMVDMHMVDTLMPTQRLSVSAHMPVHLISDTPPHYMTGSGASSLILSPL